MNKQLSISSVVNAKFYRGKQLKMSLVASLKKT